MPLCQNKRVSAFAQDRFTTAIVVEVDSVAISSDQTGIGYYFNS